ncbi:hypothetical protein L7F22_058363 [Adiantum nelumboides]|nr:hypothetical protein [Adiantum nelumboides]MCO5604201.1 hypothetical protein [Adiantum nelumboides]
MQPVRLMGWVPKWKSCGRACTGEMASAGLVFLFLGTRLCGHHLQFCKKVGLVLGKGEVDLLQGKQMASGLRCLREQGAGSYHLEEGLLRFCCCSIAVGKGSWVGVQGLLKLEEGPFSLETLCWRFGWLLNSQDGFASVQGCCTKVSALGFLS